MLTVLITKDSANKVPRVVRDLDEARQIQAQGFHVELLHDEGKTSPLPAHDKPPPVDEAHVAVGSERFSDGQTQTDETLAAARAEEPAAPVAAANKAPAKKAAAPAKKVPAKTSKKR